MMYFKVIGPQRFKMNNIITFTGKYIYTDDNTSVQRNQIIEKRIDQLLKSFSIICTIILMSYQTILIGPIFAYYYDDLRVSPLGTHLPFFELNSDADFYANMLICTIISVNAMLGGYAIELSSAIINNTILTIPDLINLNLADFFDEFQTSGNDFKSIVKLPNTFLQMQDFNG